MARKPKAKRRGRPVTLAKGERRMVRSVRLPPPLWARVDAHGETTPTIEQALIEFLDRHADNQGGKHGND